MSEKSLPKRRGLGRGLGALIVNTESPANPASDEVIAQAEAGGVRMVPIERISPNPHQPRTNFSPDALEELAASIRAHGIIQPLIVTADGSGGDAYWLVAGERRWRAARLANMTTAPVIVREASPQQLMEWALVENVQRADLNPLEEASAYQSLMDEFGMTQAEVAARVGKSRSAVANTVRLLQLPASIQSAVVDGEISAGHARALLALENDAHMEEGLDAIRTRGLNVRQTEDLVRRMLQPKPEQPAPDDPQMQAQIKYLEDRFRASLGTRVSLSRNPDGSGRLVVHFYSDDDLQHLYQRMVEEDER
jgi:ParB family chromosome partitioning protein